MKRAIWLSAALATVLLFGLACGSSESGPAATSLGPTRSGSPAASRTTAPGERTPRPTPDGDCRPTTEHIDFEILAPTWLPEGVTLVLACRKPTPAGIPDQQITEYVYENADATGWFHTSTLRIESVEPRGRAEIDLGGVTGYITRTFRPNGETFYNVEFHKEGRAYSVVSLLGAGNTLTEADLNHVALSIAQSQ